MREMIKPTISLVVICLCVGLCLALVNSITRDIIKQRQKLDAEEQRKQVMLGAKSFKELDGWKEKDGSGIVREVFSAYDEQKLLGYVFSVFPKGYGGEINVIVSVSADKRITGVKMGENKETPGLGTKASEAGFIKQYSDKDIQQEFEVVKRAPSGNNEIQAISGATISSKAITNAVAAAAELGNKLIEDGGQANEAF